ncbi:MAG: hypothetical protein L7V29_02745 [Alphaproteobacteria bacterium]|nr:hypothetical protein [Alphaproteobacteria bacterium]
MSNKMTLQEFENHVAAYGAKTALWPEQHRSAMQDFAGSNTDAAAILARAARLDAWLDDMPEAVSRHPSDELHNRIIADLETALAGKASDTGEAGKAGEIVSFPTPAALSLRAIWVGATALAACFIGGIIMAPLLVESVTGSADLLASLDIISDAFLPTDPL